MSQQAAIARAGAGPIAADVLVCGGGVAGTMAAVAAGRAGAQIRCRGEVVRVRGIKLE